MTSRHHHPGPRATLAALACGLAGCAVDVRDGAGATGGSLSGLATICNLRCDGRDPALAPDDRVPGQATVWSRRIVLHLTDRDDMAWASIDAGSPGDEAWLDRSFDGGLTWTGGSKLGDTTIPGGFTGWRTLMFNVDNPSAHGIGAVRACGKAGNRPEIACTAWFRSTVAAATPLDAAATALMQLYDPTTGLWKTTGWWNSANALTAVLDHSVRTGSTAYRYAIATTFDNNSANQFTNEFFDDTAWWGLAWIRAYDASGESRYLDMARTCAEYIWSFKDSHCGGGVWWRTDRTYKNAVANELFIKLSASLHNRIPGDATHLARAQEIWRWFQASGMINADHLINDGLDNTTCTNNGGTTWTYNQGIILGALVELNRATGDASLLATARQLAGAATASAGLNPGGILREPCEPGGCGGDGPSFKGAFVRNLGELDRVLADRPYAAYLARQASSLRATDRSSLDQYGLSWSGPFDQVDAARQHSALDLLTAAP